jgi:raffinose/stachyose/melibiose transport system substrate-binding protein
LTLEVDNTQNTVSTANSVIGAYTALHPKVNILLETRLQGTDGDNEVKTRLATGTMTDIFWYNSGSLLAALQPDKTLVDISAEPFMANIADSFKATVKKGDAVYGVPWGTAMGGGILYNRKIFKDNGLKVPTTWDEFAANNDALVKAGIAPVGQTYAAGSTWTSQLFVLADYCNIAATEPDFADKYTNNQEKYATNPAALAGFQHLEQGFKSGWYQKDFGSATFDDGLNMLATGDIAQYPMLTFALGTIAANHPDKINDIGYFGQPGTDATKNCSTIWQPGGSYIAKTSQHIPEAIAFEAFLGSVDGAAAITAAVPPTGPYVVAGAKLPADTLKAVLDVQAYLDKDAAAPALEFLSPIKGPNLENITVAVGSGIQSAADGAAAYDEDVKASAEQQGLPGW